MRFGVREICEVVFKAKANQKIGNKIFYKNEPVIYFDTLKTSSLEGAATTNYATGGRGNTRLMAWEGERTLTFTMEDALISPTGFMILSGAGLVEASSKEVIYQHVTETTDQVFVGEDGNVKIVVKQPPYTKAGEDYIYVMLLENGEPVSEPYIPSIATEDYEIELPNGEKETVPANRVLVISKADDDVAGADAWPTHKFVEGEAVLVDYYVAKTSGASQIEITPDKFGGNFYVEASTLFRDTNGVDMPAEFIIPNCKIQSNFNFTMASTGDPSTFTFTLDAFPDYTRFDKTKKVLAAIQIFGTTSTEDEVVRDRTQSKNKEDANGLIVKG